MTTEDPEAPTRDETQVNEEAMERYRLEKAREYKREVMKSKMRDWEDKNRQLGSRLFSVFGDSEDERFFVFRQPVRAEVPSQNGGMVEVYQFLVVTNNGFCLIEIDSGDYYHPIGEPSLSSRLRHHIHDAQYSPDEYRLSNYMSNTNFLIIQRGEDFLSFARGRAWSPGFEENDERLSMGRIYSNNVADKVGEIVGHNLQYAEHDIIGKLLPYQQREITAPLEAAKTLDELLK